MKYKVRSQFIPTPGFTFLAFDLSQAETWVSAYLANEPRMKDALLHSDIHTITAAAIFSDNTQCDHFGWDKETNPSTGKSDRVCKVCGTRITEEERYIGKRSNHGNTYRMSPIKWMQVINGESNEPPYVSVTSKQAIQYNRKWLNFYPRIQTWWKEIESELGQSRTLVTPYGRRRNFGGFWGQDLFKEATAFVPQSTVADHALGLVQRQLNVEGGFLGISKHPDIKRYCRIVHTAHDSIMLEVPSNREPEFAPIIFSLFRRPLVVNGEQFTIPVDGEYGDRWGELEDIPKEWLS